MSAILDLFGVRPSAASLSGAYDLSNPAFIQALDLGRATTSGERVTPGAAMGLPAYSAALRIVSGDVAKVDLELRKDRANGRGSDHAKNHPADTLVGDRWNPVMSAFEGWRVLVHRCMSWGNGYAEIVRDGNGRAVEMWPIHPTRIKPRLKDDSRTLVYDYKPDGSVVTKTLAARDIFHLKGMGDGIEGYSVVRACAESLGLGLAAQRQAARFYGEGMSKKLIATVKEKLSAPGRKGLRARIKGDEELDPVGRRQLPILEGDITLTEWGINPKEAQFIESRSFSVADVSRITGCPLWMLSLLERAQGWSTFAMSYQAYIDGTLVHHAKAIQGEARLKFLTVPERRTHHFRFRWNTLMRTLPQDRADYYTKMRRLAALSGNEIRELEGQNPLEDESGKLIPEGDLYHVASDMVPLIPEEVPEPTAPTAPTAPPKDDPEPDEPEDDPVEDDPEPEGKEEASTEFLRTSLAMLPVFHATATSLVKREAARVSAALKRYAANSGLFDAWAEKFYAQFSEEATHAFEPAFAALFGLAAMTDGPPAPRASVAVTIDRPDDLAAVDVERRAHDIARSLFSRTVESIREKLDA